MNEKQIVNLFRSVRPEIKLHGASFPGAMAGAETATKPLDELRTAEEIGHWAQEYWERLPEHPCIQGWPFNAICVMAEWWLFEHDERVSAEEAYTRLARGLTMEGGQ